MATRRIEPNQAQHEVDNGHALLVCAYDSQEKFEDNRLQGAISLAELRSREDSLSQQRELIFY